MRQNVRSNVVGSGYSHRGNSMDNRGGGGDRRNFSNYNQMGGPHGNDSHKILQHIGVASILTFSNFDSLNGQRVDSKVARIIMIDFYQNFSRIKGRKCCKFRVLGT